MSGGIDYLELPVYRINNSGRLKISIIPLNKMLSFKQAAPTDKEAGGMLFGRFIINSNDIVLDDVSTPMSRDIRKRNYFYRNLKQHSKVLEEKWIESGGTCNYLGEWHTHPEPIPSPSQYDLKQWPRILKETIFDGEFLYFMIVGTECLRIWEGCKSNLTIKEIAEIKKE